MSRRTLEETRTLLLDTAAAMLAESDAVVTIGKLDLGDVCRRAGLTSAGSAYKIWPTQDAYRRELLRHVLGTSFDQDTIDLLADTVTPEPPRATELPELSELIRSAVEVDPDTRPERAARFATYIALWLAARHDAELASDLHDTDIAFFDELVAFYDGFLGLYGLEWVPPHDATLFATMVAAVTEGLEVERAVQPAVVDRELRRPEQGTGDRPWSVLACAIGALVDACTRPRTGAAR